MYLLLPLVKGHLSNVATIFWQTGWPYYRGLLYIILRYSTMEGGGNLHLQYGIPVSRSHKRRQ